MDGFDGDKGVVILAATNRPETLDPALLRPGRFDRRVPVELPDLAGREAILKLHAQKVKLADNINLNAIARATSGASGQTWPILSMKVPSGQYEWAGNMYARKTWKNPLKW